MVNREQEWCWRGYHERRGVGGGGSTYVQQYQMTTDYGELFIPNRLFLFFFPPYLLLFGLFKKIYK